MEWNKIEKSTDYVKGKSQALRQEGTEAQSLKNSMQFAEVSRQSCIIEFHKAEKRNKEKAMIERSKKKSAN